MKSKQSNYTALQYRIPYSSSAHKVLVGKPAGNRPLGRSRCRSEDNIEINTEEMGCYDVDRVRLGEGGRERLLS
jgi:hypothetical protein